MSDVWIVVALLALATVALKATSVLAFSRRRLDNAFLAVIEGLGPALLAALVVAETLGGRHGSLSLDARVVGLGAAIGLLALRRSLVPVVAGAALAAAATRAIA